MLGSASRESHGVAIDMPAIGAVTFRRFGGPADFVGIAGVYNAVSRADDIDMLIAPGDLAAIWRPGERFVPERDAIVAEADGEIVAYGRCMLAREGAKQVCYWSAAVHPAWRRRGIGRAILRHFERHLRALAGAQPPAESRSFAVWNFTTSAASDRLLRSAGYAPARYYFTMTRPTADDSGAVTLPPGIEVRPVEPAHYRRIWEAEIEAARDEWAVPEPLESDFEQMLSDPAFDPPLWRVAWAGDEVVGMVRSSILADENAAYGRLRGYTENISVRRPWRGQGIATALIRLSLAALRERGMTEALLNVDSENESGALGLYERCGYRVTRRFAQYRKPMDALW